MTCFYPAHSAQLIDIVSDPFCENQPYCPKKSIAIRQKSATILFLTELKGLQGTSALPLNEVTEHLVASTLRTSNYKKPRFLAKLQKYNSFILCAI